MIQLVGEVKFVTVPSKLLFSMACPILPSKRQIVSSLSVTHSCHHWIH